MNYDKQISELIARTLDAPHIKDKHLDEELKDRHEASTKVVAHLITINWDSNTHSVEALQKPLNKVLAKKWIIKYLLAHEQRGSTMVDLGTGYHNHILVYDTGKTTGEVHREVYNTCKNYLGNKKHIDIQPVKLEWLSDKEDYVTGNKHDPEKEQKQTMDIIFRRQYGL